MISMVLLVLSVPVFLLKLERKLNPGSLDMLVKKISNHLKL
jgi:hypothetical protein